MPVRADVVKVAQLICQDIQGTNIDAFRPISLLLIPNICTSAPRVEKGNKFQIMRYLSIALMKFPVFPCNMYAPSTVCFFSALQHIQPLSCLKPQRDAHQIFQPSLFSQTCSQRKSTASPSQNNDMASVPDSESLGRNKLPMSIYKASSSSPKECDVAWIARTSADTGLFQTHSMPSLHLQPRMRTKNTTPRQK
jgi:hypothetical protein